MEPQIFWKTSHRRILSAGTLLLWLLSARASHALVGDSDGDFGLDGSLRTVTAAMVNYDYPILFGEANLGDGRSQSLLRLTFGGRPLDWLAYEVHGVQSLFFSSMGGTTMPGPGVFGVQGTDTRYQALDAKWDWAEENDIQGSLWLDRCNLKISLRFADVTVGRQAMTFGKAYFWNPLDVFLAFDPRQFDRDYKAGVDAIRVDFPLGDFSGINLVGVLGRRLGGLGSYRDQGAVGASWYGSALLARAFTNLSGWDLATQAGKVYGGYQLGGAAAGEVGPLEVRAEAAYFFAVDSDTLPSMPNQRELANHLTAVVGLGHRFESTLHLQAEYLFNGAGDPEQLNAALLRTLSGGSFHLGRHLLGVVGSYEILPILTGSLAGIFSFSDLSSLIQPGLALSLADEVDFLFGAMIALGSRPRGGLSPQDLGLKSEFGSYPNVYYLEFKFYF